MISSYIHNLRTKMIAANTAEYGPQAHNINWADASRILAAETRRAVTLQTAAPFLTMAAKQTKPHRGSLSPGCRICTEGKWSCLFINGRCNCRCFYCPTAQDDTSVPTTNRVSFDASEEYAQYVDRFSFSGVSISGGEPLLTFDRTIDFIETVRWKLGTEIHIWLYTNGTLATRGRLKDLKEAGLNEIRFDISAVDYDLTKPEMAAGIIDCVTVEIPAIPEDADRLAELFPAMVAAGIRHLNLHQLRLTPYNLNHLIRRAYTFLHGESVTVLESELTALALLQTAGEQGLTLPINYCSSVYKRRYQQAATRRRNAGHILKGWESITENGFIRALVLVGEPEALGSVAQKLEQHDPAKQQWSITTKRDRLQFHESLWPLINFGAGPLLVTYYEAVLAPEISYRCAFKEVRLDSGRKIFIEKRPLQVDLPVDPETLAFFENSVLQSSPPAGPIDISIPGEIITSEFIQSGLQDYF